MNKMHNSNPLFEGLEHGDLKRLVHTKMHIDEFKSKMGDDADVIVISFMVDGKEPAISLMSFIEKGYDWVLDADVSSGELEDGEYLVFAELERSIEASDNIYNLISDILNLTDQDITDWKFQYRKNSKEFDITVNNLANVIPLTSSAYIKQFGNEELNGMQESARVPIRKTAPVNQWTEQLRIAAGLK
jgi:hypothetical protein